MSPYAVDLPFATGVSNASVILAVSGVPAVANVPAVFGDPAIAVLLEIRHFTVCRLLDYDYQNGNFSCFRTIDYWTIDFAKL